MNEEAPELRITVCKLVTVSLLEVFKDVIPSYQIKHQDNPGVKCKECLQYDGSIEQCLCLWHMTHFYVFIGWSAEVSAYCLVHACQFTSFISQTPQKILIKFYVQDLHLKLLGTFNFDPCW